MSGSSSILLRSWHFPSTQLYPRRSKFLKGLFSVSERKVPASLCFCRKLQTTTYEVVKGSYVPSIQVEPDIVKQEKSPATVETIGAFQRLPMVKPSIDILYSAIRKSKMISPSKGIVNIAKREKNRGAKQLDALMKELGVPLREYMENFPNKRHLHPYERSLIELTLGDGNYEESESKRGAEERLSEGMKKLEEIFKLEGKAVDDLLNIAKTLRAVPVVDLETPTLCLVGAPNVGKSSLVRILSTGKPEVCNYPFTTRGILMGHIIVNYQRFQVTDTPGLLKRCDDNRNNLEKLTLAVLSHLPTAVLYVHDLTGECGTSPSDQFTTYKEVRKRFCNHLWIDVVSKCDLLQEAPTLFITEDDDKNHLELTRYRKAGPDGAILVSVKSETGLDELKHRVHEMLISQLSKLKTEGTTSES